MVAKKDESVKIELSGSMGVGDGKSYWKGTQSHPQQPLVNTNKPNNKNKKPKK